MDEDIFPEKKLNPQKFDVIYTEFEFTEVDGNFIEIFYCLTNLT